MRVLHSPDPSPDPLVRANLHRAAANWAANRARARERVDWEDWRERARAARADGIRHLPELLDRFEAELTARGGHVYRATTAEEANARVVDICRAAGAKLAVKGKSMVSEETGLGEALSAAGITPVETDLGEYIVAERGDRPSHLLAPAVHLSAEQVAELFTRLAGREFDPADTETLVGYARGALREQFLAADVGITGGNFLVAETGTIVLLESEGNIRLCTALPRLHIALVGIEKVIRDWEAAAHLVQMLPLAAHGRPASASTSYITGPAGEGDDGPTELHVVLLDAGRSALRGTELESALHCVRCGACLYACPVYRQMGGHRYGTTYSGPIGAVLTPALEQLGSGTEALPELSSLCGACAEACPVKIPLDEQLVALRARARTEHPARAEAALFEAWARLWSSPAGYRATAATAGRALAPLWARLAGGGAEGWDHRVPFPFAGWTQGRDIRRPAKEPFHQRWKRRQSTKPPASAISVRLPDKDRASRAESEAAAPASTGPAAKTPPTPLLSQFAENLEAVQGRVHVVDNLEAARAQARQLIGEATVARWQDADLDGIATNEAPADQAEVSLVKADTAVATTGAIAWAHGPGRSRATGILPPRQVVLLERQRVERETLAALTRFTEQPAGQPSGVVFVTGPSRTADIEQRMIRGMHAPKELDVVIYG